MATSAGVKPESDSLALTACAVPNATNDRMPSKECAFKSKEYVDPHNQSNTAKSNKAKDGGKETSNKESGSAEGGETSTKSRERSPPKSSKSMKSLKSEKSGKSGKSTKSAMKSTKSAKTAGVIRTTIRLLHPKGHRIVKISDFAEHSALIKQQNTIGKVPQSVELREYNQVTVNALADYIEKKEIKATISYYSMAELLKLTRTFIMVDLQKSLEDILLISAGESADNLLQALLIVGTGNVTAESERSLQYMAAWRFIQLAQLPTFHQLPYHQLCILLGSCELNVSHELVVGDAALLWLAGQPHPASCAPGVFSMIRAGFLNSVDRQMIIERINTLQLPETVSHFAQVSFECRHNGRICLEAAHIKRHLVRCGLPDPSKKPLETNLPLSRPRPGIKHIEIVEKSERDRTRSSRSIRKNSSRGASDKSGKSMKSKSSKRSTKSKKGKKGAKVARKGLISRFKSKFGRKNKKSATKKSAVPKKGADASSKSTKSTKSNKSAKSKKSTKSGKSSKSSKSGKSTKSDKSVSESRRSAKKEKINKAMKKEQKK